MLLARTKRVDESALIQFLDRSQVDKISRLDRPRFGIFFSQRRRQRCRFQHLSPIICICNFVQMHVCLDNI
jgi:hypothetical protein